MPHMLEYTAVAFTFACVALTVRQNIWCWPMGIIGVSLYGVLFWQERLYGNAVLQLVYLALSVYGWYAWLRGGENHQPLRVRRSGTVMLTALLFLGAVASVGLGYFLWGRTDASSPWLDASLTSFSLVAQFMLTRKLLENWLIWMTVDIFYIWMFIAQGLYPTGALYVAFFLLSARGFVEWRRSLELPEIARAVDGAPA